MTEQELSPAERRVWALVPDDARASLERGLSPTDLQTMLLATTRVRAGRVTPSRLMNRWSEDRFVQPSRHDPRKIAHIETCLWDLLPAAFQGIELSPLAPLGTCSSLASVSQNRIVSTVRGTEVLSDPTNALAVEAATRRRAVPGQLR